MYLLTYVGALLNGLTLLIVSWVGLFSLPRVYRSGFSIKVTNQLDYEYKKI